MVSLSVGPLAILTSVSYDVHLENLQDGGHHLTRSCANQRGEDECNWQVELGPATATLFCYCKNMPAALKAN